MKLCYNTQYIDFYMQENNISKEQFCEKCGISKNLLNKIYEQKSLRVDLLIPVVDVLNITLDTFLFMENIKLKRKKGLV